MLFICVLCICMLACSVVACKDKEEETQEDNIAEDTSTHTVSVNTAELFNKYFSYQVSHPLYSSTSYISVDSKLKHFVEYSGYVVFVATCEDENKDAALLKDRTVNLNSYGEGEDVYEVGNNSSYTNIFEGISYKIRSVEITMTYHHEGASGDSDLSYQSVSLTNYNYRQYFNIDISINETTQNREQVYYTRVYVTPMVALDGLYEFNNVVITFNTGITIKPDALGAVDYCSEYSSTKPATPVLTGISGNIDFYPPATYEYQFEA